MIRATSPWQSQSQTWEGSSAAGVWRPGTCALAVVCVCVYATDSSSDFMESLGGGLERFPSGESSSTGGLQCSRG